VLVADHPAMSTVAIVEDHGPLRVFLREALTAMGWTVTRIAGSVDTGEDLLLATEPELAVVDLHLASEGGGQALIGRLADAGADTRVVVFTASADPAELGHVIDAGVHGIVLKEAGCPSWPPACGPSRRASASSARRSRPAPATGSPLSSPPDPPVDIVTARCRSPKSSAAC
jgi:ActR/RegA family two-component response regulator